MTEETKPVRRRRKATTGQLLDMALELIKKCGSKEKAQAILAMAIKFGGEEDEKV